VKVLVLGSGAREHALVLALSRDDAVQALWCAPGNAGTGLLADNPAPDLDPTDAEAVAALAERLGSDLVVVGPEAPLVAGVTDAVRERGIPCFGPSAVAARIEGSKAYAKEVMAAAGVPTALAHVCDTPLEVAVALDAFGPPYVVKEDGLAAGKGVLVIEDREAAVAHAARCERVVIEEFLDGPEVSLFGVTDGTTVVPLLPAQDFKRAFDSDEGPNTGGMGAYSPLPWARPDLVSFVTRTILQPTVDELRHRGTPFVGLLYAGLALTPRGIRVVEFNARFGDPETQAVLALLRTPLGGILHAAAVGSLEQVPDLRWRDAAAVTVVVAAAGYPESPRTGDVVEGLDEVAAAVPDAYVLHAGTRRGPDGQIRSAGGRVLSIVATGSDVAAARERAYEAVSLIRLDGCHFRTDIARHAESGVQRIPSGPRDDDGGHQQQRQPEDGRTRPAIIG
jgi:phosphoribosylamine---glycine ligase